MDQFETSIDGIPCICEVTDYYPGTSYSSTSLEPSDDTEFSFTINDRKGYPAKWLEKKLTEQDNDRLFTEFLDHQDEREFDYEEQYH